MEYMIADARNPFMGLGNKTCQKPEYWCRLHRIWLSEEDALQKNARRSRILTCLAHTGVAV